jgi:hypothetical protein
LTLLDGFESSGSKSGEILEVSAIARVIVNSATTAYRESRLKATEIACMASLLKQVMYQVRYSAHCAVNKDSYVSMNLRHDAPTCHILKDRLAELRRSF